MAQPAVADSVDTSTSVNVRDFLNAIKYGLIRPSTIPGHIIVRIYGTFVAKPDPSDLEVQAIIDGSLLSVPCTLRWISHAGHLEAALTTKDKRLVKILEQPIKQIVLMARQNDKPGTPYPLLVLDMRASG